jgi:hypothetical protein
VRKREKDGEREREKGVKQIWDYNGDYQFFARPRAQYDWFVNSQHCILKGGLVIAVTKGFQKRCVSQYSTFFAL